MIDISLDFNKIVVYKNKKFKIKKVKMLKNIVFNYFTKQNVSKNKKKLKFIYFGLFKEFESISSFLPKMYKINLKYTNKKKKLKTRLFLKIHININKKVLFFFDNFFVKYLYFYVKNLEILKKKKYMYIQEAIISRFKTKIKIKYSSLNFNAMILKNFFDFSKIFYLRSKTKKRRERINFLKNNKYRYLNLKIKLNSNYINYFFKLIYLFILNNYKINLLFYKKYLNKYVN